MLDGVVKGDLKLSKTIFKYLEMCLNCGKCSEYCPSGIDVSEIFAAAKAEYLAGRMSGDFLKWLEGETVFDNLIKLSSKVLGDKTEFTKPKSARKKLLYFKGCAGALDKNGETSLKKILSNLTDIELIEKDFKCCGVPFLSSGNLTRAEEVKQYNTEIINSAECDYVVTDCASCCYQLSRYGTLNKPVVMLGEILAKEEVKFVFDKPTKVTFHKPCHLTSDEFIYSVLNKCENIEYVQMEDYDECCGFAGQFAITNHKLSKKLSIQKIKHALDTNSDVVITSCPACVLGLRQGAILSNNYFGKKIKILSLTEFLGRAKIITGKTI